MSPAHLGSWLSIDISIFYLREKEGCSGQDQELVLQKAWELTREMGEANFINAIVETNAKCYFKSETERRREIKMRSRSRSRSE